MVKEVKSSRAAKEADDAARQAALAAAAEQRVAADKARHRVAAVEAALLEASKARDDAASRAALFSDELRSVRVSLAEAQAARKFTEERLGAMERERAEAHAKSEAEARALEMTGGWVERESTEPCPPIDMTSPVIGSILQSATPDTKRVADTWAWLKAAAVEDVARLKPARLELDRVPAEARDGMLTMIIPILRQRKDVRFRVLVRERHEVRTDLRLLAEDMKGTVPPPAGAKDKVATWRSPG